MVLLRTVHDAVLFLFVKGFYVKLVIILYFRSVDVDCEYHGVAKIQTESLGI